MIEWETRFEALNPSAAFPHLHNCAVESRRDLSYHCEGRRRKDETCLFDLTLEGEGVFRDARGERRLGPGKAFLCVLNDPACSYRYPEGATERWRFLWICFSGGGSAEMLRELVAKRGAVAEMPLGSPYVRSLLAYEKEAGRTVRLRPAESARLALELLAEAEKALELGGACRSREDALAERAQEFLLAGLESGADVAGAAKELGISREHLSRLFHRRVGLNVSEWLQRRRLALAARLLKEPGLSCKELAWRLGYSSQANFSRAFKKATGRSPAQFRDGGGWLPL